LPPVVPLCADASPTLMARRIDHEARDERTEDERTGGAMSIELYFPEDIERILRCAMLARYGNATPRGGEFLEALDAVAAAVGLERVATPKGYVSWIERRIEGGE